MEQTESEYAEKRASGSLKRMVGHLQQPDKQTMTANYEPDGIKWTSDQGTEFLLITAGPHKGWVCKRHPDGQWVTDQKPSEQDRIALLDKLNALRHG